MGSCLRLIGWPLVSTCTNEYSGNAAVSLWRELAGCVVAEKLRTYESEFEGIWLVVRRFSPHDFVGGCQGSHGVGAAARNRV